MTLDPPPATPTGIGESDGRRLVSIAHRGIVALLDRGREQLDPEGLPPVLLAPGSSFVTLEKEGRLRGCIGSLHPRRPLAEDVWANARAAASQDPRFAPVTRDELPSLTLEVSVLSPLEPVDGCTRERLLASLEPFVDGLLIVAGGSSATFLPQVWAHLDDPSEFLPRLFEKAGLPPGRWPADLEAFRYRVKHFGS